MGNTVLKMNLGTIFLITGTFLMVFAFSLKGAAPSNEEFHGLLGYSVLLHTPKFTDTPTRVQWVKLTDMKFTLIQRRTNWDTTIEKFEKYNILNNGSLSIDNLVMKDAGNYKVEGHKGKFALFKETTVTLKVHEPLPPPQLIENCPNKILICQVAANASRNLKVKLLQDNKEKKYQGQKHVNGAWWWTFHLTNLTGKFKCEVASDPIKNQTEKEINCPETVSQPLNLTHFAMIGGGAFILIILMALIVYCVRKKRAERREIEDQEIERMAQVADNELRHRKLPQPPLRAVPNQAHQQEKRQPLLRSELQQAGGPPQPCPRPPQRKPPRHMKERP